MKFVVIGDLHFGVKNDSPYFHAMFNKFFTNEFIPYLKDHNITQVMQLGDLFDKRKSLCFNTLSECKRYFFRPLEEAGITLHTLIGNHDIYFRQSLSVNSSGLVLGEFKNVHVYDKPSSIQLADTTIDLIPWICDENKEYVFEFIANSRSDLCCGHFEIEHFKMNKNMPAQEGISKDIFARYESVWSGHYHTRSDNDNIHYVGTPYELTWADYEDPKGFQVFDTETRQTENIATSCTMFHRHEYDDIKNDYPAMDYSMFDQKYIKIVVINKTDSYIFDLFLKKLYSLETYEIKILEDLSDFSEGTVSTEINMESTIDVLDAYIESVADESNCSTIKSFMKSIYLEALALR
jgi:DNA repair exonuclease SbcCD nuclease subunit